MVISSLSPLFVLWAIRGVELIPEPWFSGFCIIGFFLSNGVLFTKIILVQRNKDDENITIGDIEDNRHHLLVYLFAILLPFYRQEITSTRELTAIVVAISFIIFLFWHLNLHYMNILFAIRGYRIYTIQPPEDGNPYTTKDSYILITTRTNLFINQQIIAYRLSSSVYWEKKS